MEVAGVTFAVASLTLQLVDGVDRFQTFFEECRDPTISVQDLVGQLKAVRQLLQILEREATKPGSENELAGATSLQDELCRSKCRLQELTNLVAKFEAGSYPPWADRNRGKVRLTNYFKLHSQQKKIRRYADKLDRTRTTVIDHFHVTMLSKVSDLHSDQQERQKYRDSDLQPGISEQSNISKKRLVSRQPNSHSQGAVVPHNPMASDRPGQATDRATSQPGREFNIKHRDGSGIYNFDNTQIVRRTGSGGETVMFDQTIGKRSAIPRPSQPVPDPEHPQNSNTEQSIAPPTPAEDTPVHNAWESGPVTVDSTGDAIFNKGNSHDVADSGGKSTMFRQHMPGDEN
jgi:hypothetical protein